MDPDSPCVPVDWRVVLFGRRAGDVDLGRDKASLGGSGVDMLLSVVQ